MSVNRRNLFLVVAGAMFVSVVMAAIFVPDWLESRRQAEAARLEQECQLLAEDGNWEGLEVAAVQWTKVDPQAADAWLNAAEAVQQQGRLDETIEFLLQVPQKDPKSRHAFLYASEMQLGEARQPAQGLETLARLRRMAPSAEAVRSKLISLYAMTLQRERMIEEIRDAFQYRAEPPEAYVYLMIADHLSFTNGFQLNTQWLAAEPDSELFAVARSLQLADTLRKLENQTPETQIQREAAEAELVNLSEKFPQNRTLILAAIRTAIDDEDVAQVGQLLDSLPAAVEPDSLSLRYKGWHLMKTGQAAEAEQSYLKSIALLPLDWHSWHELANVLRQQARLEDAAAAAELAVIGKELRKDCMALPDAGKANPELLSRMYSYASAVGANDVAAAIRFRLGY